MCSAAPPSVLRFWPPTAACSAGLGAMQPQRRAPTGRLPLRPAFPLPVPCSVRGAAKSWAAVGVGQPPRTGLRPRPGCVRAAFYRIRGRGGLFCELLTCPPPRAAAATRTCSSVPCAVSAVPRGEESSRRERKNEVLADLAVV